MSENDKTPSVKLPSARDISRTDFKPHGINKNKGALKRPANKADLRKKRMIQAGASVLALAVVGGVAGGAYALTRPEEDFKVEGAFNKDPKVKFPEVKPYAAGSTQTLIAGTGEQLAKGDTAYLNFETYSWTGAKKYEEKSSSFAKNEFQPIKVGEGSGFKQLDEALTKAKVGSRFLLTIPVKDMGEAAAQTGLAKTDNVVFVVDVLNKQGKVVGKHADVGDEKLPKIIEPAKDGDAPKFEIPKDETPPKELVIKTLIEGTGPVVQKGQQLIANYEGQIWRTNKAFDSSWTRKEPATFEIGTGKVISGWDKALVGVKAGSRILIVIPPDEGYKKEGNKQAGIKGDDTLVFVVDVLTSI